MIGGILLASLAAVAGAILALLSGRRKVKLEEVRIER